MSRYHSCIYNTCCTLLQHELVNVREQIQPFFIHCVLMLIFQCENRVMLIFKCVKMIWSDLQTRYNVKPSNRKCWKKCLQNFHTRICAKPLAILFSLLLCCFNGICKIGNNMHISDLRVSLLRRKVSPLMNQIC